MAPPLNLGPTANKIMAALAQHGPMTVREILEECGITLHQWTSATRGLVRPTRFGPRRIRIAGWTRGDGRSGKYYRAVALYALGSRPDAPRPPKEANVVAVRRYQAKRLAQARSASVFHLVIRSFDAATKLKRAA